MGRLAAIVLFVIVLAAVVLALQAPASWLAHRLSLATNDAVQVIDTRGTVWNGEGTLASADRRFTLPLAWRLSAGALMRGNVELELKPQAGRATPRGTLIYGRGNLEAREFVLDLPASALESGFRAGAPLAIGGELKLEAREFVLAGAASRGRLDVAWTRARLAATDGTTVDLGEIRGVFEPRGGALVGRLENRGGDVALSGTATLPLAGGDTTLDATLAPREGAPASTLRALSALGAPSADGSVRLQWRSAPR